MTTPHKHAALIKAWADGAEIESKHPIAEKWYITDRPGWVLDYEYRVKPAEKFHVLAYTPVTTGGDGWTENRLTTPLDPAATRWSLGRTDGEGDRLFLFDTRADADAACQAVNKSLTFA